VSPPPQRVSIAPAGASGPTASTTFRISHLRWYICAILFVATTINYLDRQSVSVLKEVLQTKIGWDEAGYGWINFSFQVAYAIMFLVSGRLLDRFGVRLGMFWAVFVWSVAAIAHAFASTPLRFAVARFTLGLGEAANWPASIKAVAEWFPRRERALATGIFNSGTNVAVVLGFAIVWLAQTYSWQMAFIVTGGLGFIFLAAWVSVYRSPLEHPWLTDPERRLIQADKQDLPLVSARPPAWTTLLRYPQTWAFLIPKTLTDPVWWFYLLWLPGYLNRERGLSVTASAATMAIPYVAASIGSVGGGWLSGLLMKKRWPVGKARFATMGLFASCMPAAIWAVSTHNSVLAVALISLATASHQGWSANLYTLSSDMFPEQLVGSVVGLGSMCGAIGGMFMTLIAGGVLQWVGSYKPLFILAGVMHPLSLALALAFVGWELRPVHLDSNRLSSFSGRLAASGVALLLFGIGLIVEVSLHWGPIVAATRNSISTAAGGLVAATGIALLGVALLYASMGRRPSDL
jgi:ACS family hexuronate transporter-like MFS transporter